MTEIPEPGTTVSITVTEPSVFYIEPRTGQPFVAKLTPDADEQRAPDLILTIRRRFDIASLLDLASWRVRGSSLPRAEPQAEDQKEEPCDDTP